MNQPHKQATIQQIFDGVSDKKKNQYLLQSEVTALQVVSFPTFNDGSFLRVRKAVIDYSRLELYVAINFGYLQSSFMRNQIKLNDSRLLLRLVGLAQYDVDVYVLGYNQAPSPFNMCTHLRCTVEDIRISCEVCAVARTLMGRPTTGITGTFCKEHKDQLE